MNHLDAWKKTGSLLFGKKVQKVGLFELELIKFAYLIWAAAMLRRISLASGTRFLRDRTQARPLYKGWVGDSLFVLRTAKVSNLIPASHSIIGQGSAARDRCASALSRNGPLFGSCAKLLLGRFGRMGTLVTTN